MLGDRIDGCDYSVDSSFFHRHADEVVEFPGADEREEATFAFATVAFQNLNGGRCQIDLYDSRTLFFGLARNVLDCCSVFRCDDVVLGEGEEVADTAADIALEHENVTGRGDFVA